MSQVEFTFTLANLFIGNVLKKKKEEASKQRSEKENKIPEAELSIETFKEFQKTIQFFITFVADNFLSSSEQDMQLSKSELSEIVSRISTVYSISGYCYSKGLYISGKDPQGDGYVEAYYNKDGEKITDKSEIMKLWHYQAGRTLFWDLGIGDMKLWLKESSIDQEPKIEIFYDKTIPYVNLARNISRHLINKHNKATERPFGRGDCAKLGSTIVLSDIFYKKLFQGQKNIKYDIALNYIIRALENAYPDKRKIFLRVLAHFFLTGNIEKAAQFKKMNHYDKMKLALKIVKIVLFDKPEEIELSEFAFNLYKLIDRI